MSRGLYSYITRNKVYSDAEKDWIVELSNTNMVWYDLLVNANDVAEYFNTRELTVNYLKKIKQEVEESLEKRFVYFICSRTKTRFNTKYKPRYNFFSKQVKIQLLIGNKKKKNIKVVFADSVTEKLFKPKIEITEKYITMHIDSQNKTTLSVHDFLSKMNVNLGICSNVEYVGYTKNPHTRPTNGAHTGLSDMLFSVSNEERDTLLFFNTFKVTTMAVHNQSKMNFYVSNPMTDEIDVDLEGKLIEKSFILYFDSNNQNRNKENEKNELKSNLHKISKENSVNSISYFYELDGDSEYWKFSSSNIEGKMKHAFKVKLEHRTLKIKDISE